MVLVIYLFSQCPQVLLCSGPRSAYSILHTSLPAGILIGFADGRHQRNGRWQEERRDIPPVFSPFSKAPANTDD